MLNPSTPHAITYPSASYPHAYSSTVHQEACPQPQFVPQIEYIVSTVNQQTHLVKFPQIDSGLVVLVFKSYGKIVSKAKEERDATWFREKVLLVEAQGNGKVLNEEELEFLADLGIVEGPVTHSVITRNAAYQVDDLDAYDSDCDKISIAKAILMANLSSYRSDVLSEVVQIVLWYLDSGCSKHMTEDCSRLTNFVHKFLGTVKFSNDEVAKIMRSIMTIETLSAELERYKEWVKLLEERQNVDLGTREKLIIDDIIQEKNAQFTDFGKEINNLKQTLSEQSKKKELLTKTFNFSKRIKEKEAKNIDTEIALEKKVKELDNIVCKMGQSAQTVHMLTKPQVFYDNNLKQALDSKLLNLEEESRSKMLLKQSDPMVLEKKVNTKPIDYAELNRLSKDFGKRFVPQRELSVEQALHPIINKSASSPVKIEAPWELPKMEVVVQQYHIDKQCFEIQKKQFLFENDRLLDQIISQDIVNIVVNSSVDPNTSVNVNSSVAMIESVNYVEICNKCLELEAELIKQHNMVEKDEYNRLSKRFSELEQHCISLEIAMQLNKEIFQKNNTSVNQTEPSFDQLFELNNLKAELQAKDTTIKKLKAHIKRVNETSTSESVKKDLDEIETINIELEHRVTRLIAKNEHLKQTYKQLYDSIKPSRIRAKEKTESLVNQVNQKSAEISDLNAQLQEKVFVIRKLKNDLRKLKGKDTIDNAAQMSNATTMAPGMYKLDPIILAPQVKNYRETHEYYLKHTMERVAILREVVEQAKS
ncbi:hypothetical protein Tco_0236596 [Tanacetum coccineum]